MKTILLVYLLAISVFAAIITFFDKLRAIHHKWRVRESTLLLTALLGGSAAMYLTMLLIRHKTRHMKFMLGIPLIIVVQIAVIYVTRKVLYV